MKKDIHPKYYTDAKVECACGNKFTVGSTKPEIKVEICFKCHPFYTGKEKVVDTVGKLEKFRKRREKASVKKVRSKTTKKAERKKKEVNKK